MTPYTVGNRKQNLSIEKPCEDITYKSGNGTTILNSGLDEAKVICIYKQLSSKKIYLLRLTAEFGFMLDN